MDKKCSILASEFSAERISTRLKHLEEPRHKSILIWETRWTRAEGLQQGQKLSLDQIAILHGKVLTTQFLHFIIFKILLSFL